MISTIRSIYDENGNYLPAGNYYYEINDYNHGIFIGDITNSEGIFGKFKFSSLDLVKMMAVGQSRLLNYTDLSYEIGMPNYPVPISNPSPNSYIPRITTNSFRYNTIRNNTIRNNTVTRYTNRRSVSRSRYVVDEYNNINTRVRRDENTRNNASTRQDSSYDCTICMEKIRPTDKKTLNCNHNFHRECINMWLLENNTCPICRASQSTNRYTSSISSRNNTSSTISFLRRDRFYNAVDELQRSYRENRIIFRHK